MIVPSYFSRIANTLLLNNINDDELWNNLKKVKLEKLSKKFCTNGQIDFNGETSVKNQVNEVMDKLGINSTIQQYDNMTDVIMERAANMFMYLIFCPKDTKPWIFFYTDLFKNEHVDKIVLTLHRILKSKASPKNEKFQLIARKLYTKITTILSFKSKDIQNMIQGITEPFWNEEGMYHVQTVRQIGTNQYPILVCRIVKIIRSLFVC